MSDAGAAPANTLARYIVQSNHFASTTKRVKHYAFMPPRDLRLSVFLVGGLLAEDIWSMGYGYVAQPQEKTLYAWAELPTSAPAQVGLTLDPDDDPPGHANITGWPNEKHTQMSHAQELADRSTLRLPESGSTDSAPA